MQNIRLQLTFREIESMRQQMIKQILAYRKQLECKLRELDNTRK